MDSKKYVCLWHKGAGEIKNVNPCPTEDWTEQYRELHDLPQASLRSRHFVVASTNDSVLISHFPLTLSLRKPHFSLILTPFLPR